MTKLKADRGTGNKVQGEALVCTDSIHFGQDFSDSGVGQNPRHELYGKSIKDKILILTHPKSGSGHGGMALLEMAANKGAPKGLIYQAVNPVVVFGAILTDIPIMDQFDQNPVDVIHSGDSVTMNPKTLVVEVSPPA